MYPKDTEKWKQFTTSCNRKRFKRRLLCIPKILKNESNSQRTQKGRVIARRCCVSQRYWKMKAIHNYRYIGKKPYIVVVYPKDTEKWKQFTTRLEGESGLDKLLCIPKILKNESNSQLAKKTPSLQNCCCVSQRYWKMKAIHNKHEEIEKGSYVVVYPKDTEKWKQFTTSRHKWRRLFLLLCIPKILKNESNSQRNPRITPFIKCCCVSQRYWKMKAIHNSETMKSTRSCVVVYPKDTEKWKQFTTSVRLRLSHLQLLCIPKILKNESNSQRPLFTNRPCNGCCVSQRYWKMKAIHNRDAQAKSAFMVVVYPKDTEKWKQFTTWGATWTIKPPLLCIPKILKNESNSQQCRKARVNQWCCCVSQRYWKMKAIHNRFKSST